MDPRAKDKEKIINGQEEAEPLNPQEREYQPVEEATAEQKEKGYEEGNRKDNITEDDNESNDRQNSIDN